MCAAYVMRHPGAMSTATCVPGSITCMNGAAVVGHRPMERPLETSRLGDHLDRLYRAAWALAGSREDAEDLVQETFAPVRARPRLFRNETDLGYPLRARRITFRAPTPTESRRLRTD